MLIPAVLRNPFSKRYVSSFVKGFGLLGINIAIICSAVARTRSATEVLEVMERVADWQLAHTSTHPATDWTQGASDAGFMALAGISAHSKYREAMESAGRGNQWKPGPHFYDADDVCVGQMYAELYFERREKDLIAPLRERFDAVLATPTTVTSLEFKDQGKLARENWSWCDSLFMGPPAWIRLYAATGDTRYLDFAVTNWWRTTDYLYDREEHLFFRDSTYFDRREANGKKVFWSRGNGWVMAGLARFLQYLPTNYPDRARFERLFQEMAAKIIVCQQPDGMWRASLLDPTSYPLQEASGSGFYTFALAWGVNQGLLARRTYEPAVNKAWQALVNCVNPDGKLTHVQPIGADPKHFDENATEVYGVGAFLLAGTEVYRLDVFEKQTPIAIRVTNSAKFFRQNETVEIENPQRRGKPLFAKGIAVIDGPTTRILDSQLYTMGGPKPAGKLLFQVDLAPGETRTFFLVDSTRLPGVPTPLIKTFARTVPERFDDLAWESDRIAFRMYGPALIKSEGTISSGVDVWAKRTRNLVVNRWYKDGDYHNDHGEGMDDYHVSRSRGCGGLGVWDGHALYVSSNYRGAQIITTGPIRSEFELTYDTFDAAGEKVTETKRVSIDAGSNLSRLESVFRTSEEKPLQIAVGIAQRVGEAVLTQNQSEGWISYWQPDDRDRGSIACAVILEKGIAAFTRENASITQLSAAKLATADSEGLPPSANLLAVARAEVGQPFVYWAGAGWSKSGDFPDAKSWENYVRRFRERLLSPLKIVVAAQP